MGLIQDLKNKLAPADVVRPPDPVGPPTPKPPNTSLAPPPVSLPDQTAQLIVHLDGLQPSLGTAAQIKDLIAQALATLDARIRNLELA